MKVFTTHTGQRIKGDRLRDALNTVANDWARMTHAIRVQDDYASHVTEKHKDNNLANGLALAEEIRGGAIDSFTIWQRVNTVLTGECVAFLSKANDDTNDQ